MIKLNDTCYDRGGSTDRDWTFVNNSSVTELIVSHWNSLPSHILEADTVLTFKKRLDVCSECGKAGEASKPDNHKYEVSK